MKCAILSVLFLSSCRLVDYIEVSGRYGEGEFANRFDQEYYSGELTLGWWLNRSNPPVEIHLPGGYSVHAKSSATDMPPVWSPMVEGGVPHDGGLDQPLPEVQLTGPAPWYGSPAFITALSGLLGALSVFFGRKHIERGLDHVKGKVKEWAE